jgi:2-dehydropantoate 2-reductase
MKVVVVGAGGVGGLFGGMLARSGAEVGFVARGKHLEALRGHGLEVESPLGSFKLSSVAAAEDPAQLGQADAILIALKAWQVAEMAPRLRPLLRPGTVVLPLQNGVEAAGALSQALGAEHVVGGVCEVLAWIESPGRIRHVGFRPRITTGELDGGAGEKIGPLAEALRAAGLEVVITREVGVAIWEKLLLIEPFGAVGAATRAAAGLVWSVPETRAILRAALTEVAALSAARGASVREGAVERVLLRIKSMAPDTTFSMQRDILAGRPSELFDQTGAVVRLGKESQVPTPVHDVLFAALLPQEQVARGQAGQATRLS